MKCYSLFSCEERHSKGEERCDVRRGSWLTMLYSHSGSREQLTHVPSPFLFSFSSGLGRQAQGAVLPTFKMDLPVPVNLIKIIPTSMDTGSPRIPFISSTTTTLSRSLVQLRQRQKEEHDLFGLWWQRLTIPTIQEAEAEG